MLKLLGVSIGRRHESGTTWYLQGNSGGLLLDAGANATQEIEDVGLIFVSHAHVDHVGALIDLVERFPRARRVASVQTLRSLEAVLVNELKMRGGKIGRAHAIVDTFEPKKFHAPFVHDEFELTLLPAGHVPGSSMLLVERKAPAHRLLYTGDWSPFQIPGIEPVVWPEDVDTLILESALAAHHELDGYSVEEAIQTLGSLSGALILASPVGEARLVWESLKGRDGFCVHENLRSFLPEADFGLTHDCVRTLEQGGVVLAAGKELDFNTPSRALVQSIIGDATKSVRIVNGVKSRSLGDQFLHAGNRAKVQGLGRRRVQASILELTLHAPPMHLMRAVEDLAPGRVVLTHQDEKVLHAFKRKLGKHLEGKANPEIIVPSKAYIDLERLPA